MMHAVWLIFIEFSMNWRSLLHQEHSSHETFEVQTKVAGFSMF
jgi:hypothetical protein